MVALFQFRRLAQNGTSWSLELNGFDSYSAHEFKFRSDVTKHLLTCTDKLYQHVEWIYEHTLHAFMSSVAVLELIRYDSTICECEPRNTTCKIQRCFAHCEFTISARKLWYSMAVQFRKIMWMFANLGSCSYWCLSARHSNYSNMRVSSSTRLLSEPPLELGPWDMASQPKYDAVLARGRNATVSLLMTEGICAFCAI